MKKQITTFLASTLLAGSLALPACGGQSPTDEGNNTTESVEHVEEVDPAEKFIGTWKLAGGETQGVTLVGDLTAMLGEEASMGIILDEGGTGTVTSGEDTNSLTWELDGDEAVKVTIEHDEDADDSEPSTVRGTLEDGVLRLNMGESDEDGIFLLTKSGELENVRVIAPANATPITSEDELVGTWNLAGANMMGISIYGSPEDLSEFTGDDVGNLTLEAGGTGTMGDADISWNVTEDGATIGEDGVSLPLKALDDGIVMDMGELMGIDLAFYFVK